VLIPADIRFPLERANGVQVVKTAAALAAGGWPTTLLVRRSDPRPAEEILALYGVAPEAHLRVRRLAVRHRRGSFALPRAAFLLRAAAAAARARGVVFTRDLQLADVLLRLVPRLRRRLVYEAHAVESLMYAERSRLYAGAPPPDPAKERRLFRREGRVWRKAAAIVTTTDGIRRTLGERYGPRERTAVVPNGCDRPAGAFPGLATEEPPRVLYAGQLYPWKGVDVLVEAVARVPGCRLVVLGGLPGESDLERVRALVEARGLAARSELRGTVPQREVAAELQRAAVVAVPFLHTGMTEAHTSPLKAFEAMAAGRPIVASDLPSSREFLRDGDNALLVPPGDADALAGALRRLLDDRALALRLAGAAFAEAPRYAWPERARRLGALFEALP
jgi:glycosyltransferase involved in cell wall biosynthesis